MIFDKSRPAGAKEDVFFIDASREFEQGTNQNRLRPQDMDKIVETFRTRTVIDKYSHLASFEEIEENDFNLNIPRYVDTFEPEPEIDMEEVQKDIVRINKDLAKVEAKVDSYLEELGFKS